MQGPLRLTIGTMVQVAPHTPCSQPSAPVRMQMLAQEIRQVVYAASTNTCSARPFTRGE